MQNLQNIFDSFSYLLMTSLLDSMYSYIFMLENIWYHFTRSGPNSQEIVNFIPNMGPGGTKLNWSKIHNFLWIRFTLGKIMTSYDF